MVALALHEGDQSLECLDPLVRLQPAVAIAKHPGGSVELAFERHLLIIGDFRQRHSVECLDNLDHRFPFILP
jgi:hypothetical protein